MPREKSICPTVKQWASPFLFKCAACGYSGDSCRPCIYEQEEFEPIQPKALIGLICLPLVIALVVQNDIKIVLLRRWFSVLNPPSFYSHHQKNLRKRIANQLTITFRATLSSCNIDDKWNKAAAISCKTKSKWWYFALRLERIKYTAKHFCKPSWNHVGFPP